jgi:hypothetical protein
MDIIVMPASRPVHMPLGCIFFGHIGVRVGQELVHAGSTRKPIIFKLAAACSTRSSPRGNFTKPLPNSASMERLAKKRTTHIKSVGVCEVTTWSLIRGPAAIAGPGVSAELVMAYLQHDFPNMNRGLH